MVKGHADNPHLTTPSLDKTQHHRKAHDVSRSPSPESVKSSVRDSESPVNSERSSRESSPFVSSSTRKYVAQNSWVANEWLLKRRIKKEVSSSPTEDSVPAKEVSFGTETGQWDRLTASRIRSKWANKEGAPYFASPKPDDSLTSAFDQVKAKHKQTWSALDTAMSSAGASAHAILSAESFLRHFVKDIPKDFQDIEEYRAWREEVKDSFKKNAFSPLAEATSCLAAVVNNSVKEVRCLVVDTSSARNLKSCLKEALPSATTFFGNPTERINSAISNSFMLSSMGSNRSTAAAKFTATTRKFSGQSKPFTKSRSGSGSSAFKKPANASSKKPGNDSRRPGRGGRAGQK